MRRISIKGFTLAEVLVTLVIIGVIAALTIPALIQSTQNAELITAWKKSYSVISQAQLGMVRDYGSVSGAFGNIDYSSNGGNNFMNGWLPYLSVVKTCTAGRIMTDGCDPVKFEALDGSSYPNYNNLAQATGLVLSDGTFINFYPGVCSGTLCFDSKLFVDVNGTKGPNIMGKDVFMLSYLSTKDRFIPGTGGFNCNGDGHNCSGYYLAH